MTLYISLQGWPFVLEKWKSSVSDPGILTDEENCIKTLTGKEHSISLDLLQEKGTEAEGTYFLHVLNY